MISVLIDVQLELHERAAGEAVRAEEREQRHVVASHHRPDERDAAAATPAASGLATARFPRRDARSLWPRPPRIPTRTARTRTRTPGFPRGDSPRAARRRAPPARAGCPRPLPSRKLPNTCSQYAGFRRPVCSASMRTTSAQVVLVERLNGDGRCRCVHAFPQGPALNGHGTPWPYAGTPPCARRGFPRSSASAQTRALGEPPAQQQEVRLAARLACLRGRRGSRRAPRSSC